MQRVGQPPRGRLRSVLGGVPDRSDQVGAFGVQPRQGLRVVVEADRRPTSASSSPTSSVGLDDQACRD